MEETGFTKIPNEILEALFICGLPKEKQRVFHYLIRKIWGWNKESDTISSSQISKATGLKRQNAHRALIWLEANSLISVITSDYKRIKTIRINKKYKTWKPYQAVSKKANNKNVITSDYNLSSPVITNGVKNVITSDAHKRNIYKEKKESTNRPEKSKKIFSDSSPKRKRKPEAISQQEAIKRAAKMKADLRKHYDIEN